MPRYDFLCEDCGLREELFIKVCDLDKYDTKICTCGAVAARQFPLTARPHVEWEKPEFSFKHGKYLSSKRQADRADQELREPDMEKYAMDYAREEARLKASLGEEQYEELNNA